jgi:hypothetical protein
LLAAEFRRPGGQVVVASAGLAAAIICTARVSPEGPPPGILVDSQRSLLH